MIIETIRAAAFVGLMTSHSGEDINHSSSILPSTSTNNAEVCIPTRTVIYCPSFQIERTTPHATNMVDIQPRVYHWKSLREWQEAFLHGWSNGLDYLYERGCVVLSTDRKFTSGKMTVVVADGSCTGIGP